MIAFQNSYAEAIKDLGLKRGERGSKARHQHIKDYYRALNAGARLANQLGIDSSPQEPKQFAGWMKTHERMRESLDESASQYQQVLLANLEETNTNINFEAKQSRLSFKY